MVHAIWSLCIGGCCDVKAEYRFQLSDEGGEGDCCFPAMVASLLSHNTLDSATQSHWLNVLQRESLPDKDELAIALRQLAAYRFAKMSPEQLLETVISLVGQSQSDEPWHDTCSPRKLVEQCGLGVVLRAESVFAVGSDELGRPDDIEIGMMSAGGPSRVTAPQGRQCLEKLRNDLWGIYAKPCRTGGWHWGTQDDIGAVAEALGIGVVVVTDGSSTGRWVYSMALTRCDFNLFMLLVSEHNVQFVRGMLHHTGWTRPLSIVSRAQVPDGLVTHYNICNTSIP